MSHAQVTFLFLCYRNESNIYNIREKGFRLVGLCFRPQGLQSLFSTHPIFSGNKEYKNYVNTKATESLNRWGIMDSELIALPPGMKTVL